VENPSSPVIKLPTGGLSGREEEAEMKIWHETEFGFAVGQRVVILVGVFSGQAGMVLAKRPGSE
jgi:hypothetical protein